MTAVGTNQSYQNRALDRSTTFSIVIPVFNEAESLPHLYECLKKLADSLPVTVEFVLVNDGSFDQSLPLMIGFSQNDGRFRIVDLSRNFGHQMAVSAGLSVARGGVIAIIDADLQDPPEVLGAMLVRWAAGIDIVYGQRLTRRGESQLKLMTASFYYRLLSRLANVKIPINAGDFRIVDRRVVEIINLMPERHRFLRGMFAWVGFSQEAFLYDRAERYAGKTKYTWRKMFNFSVDGVLSFSVMPLRWMTMLGLMTTVLAFVSGAYLLFLRPVGRTRARNFMALPIRPIVTSLRRK